MRMQPVGVGLGQPGADAGQLLDQRDVAAGVLGRGVEREAPCVRQQLQELGQEAARRDGIRPPTCP